jgi:hypothetical protein
MRNEPSLLADASSPAEKKSCRQVHCLGFLGQPAALLGAQVGERYTPFNKLSLIVSLAPVRKLRTCSRAA